VINLDEVTFSVLSAIYEAIATMPGIDARPGDCAVKQAVGAELLTRIGRRRDYEEKGPYTP
jgi:hypothetical protein